MDDGIRLEFFKSLKELFFFKSNINFFELNSFARNLLPSLYPFLDWLNWVDSGVSIFFINFSSVEVVNDQNLIA